MAVKIPELGIENMFDRHLTYPNLHPDEWTPFRNPMATNPGPIGAQFDAELA